jgi:phosphoenolpyruvate carboxykinase (ATP)
MQKYTVNVWLVNTGWSGGPYGVGSRIRLRYTRAIVDAIHRGVLADAPTRTDPVFGFEVVTAVPEVPPAILLPRDTWDDPAAYDEMAAKLARLFDENFIEYQDHCEPEVREAGPRA